MLTLVGAIVVAGAIVWAAQRVAAALAASRAEASRAKAAELLATFAPAIAAAASDPRAILTWQPLARTARRLFPDAFALLDGAAGDTFPFSTERIHEAHARWTTEWLAWERAHDAEYKLKAAAVEHELAASGGAPTIRARLDAVEREELDSYQRRYEEYIRIARALQSLATP